MECSVRYVREEDSYGTVTSSLRPALCFRGRKVVHAVVSDETRVRVIEISLQQYDRANALQYHGHEYPIGRMIKTLQTAAQRKGITQRAVALLERPEVVTEDNLPPDEPAVTGAMPERASLVSALDTEPRETGSPGAQADIEVLFGKEAVRASVKRFEAARKASRFADLPTSFILEHRIAEARRGEVKKEKKAAATPSIETAKSTLVAKLATEVGMQPQPLRVLLRAAGMRAPYTDLDAMRKAIKK